MGNDVAETENTCEGAITHVEAAGIGSEGGHHQTVAVASEAAPAHRAPASPDPRERANLKDRNKDIFAHLKTDWEAWNGSMLPERPRPATYSNPGNLLADHYGVTNPQPAAPPSGSAQ